MRKSNFVIIAIALALFIGCNKNKHGMGDPSPSPQTVSMQVMPDSNFVPFEAAEMMAERIDESFFLTNSYKNITRTISSSFTLYDNKGVPALYVFNYSNQGGYSVLSADYRYEPISAFTKKDTLGESGEIPSMLGSWFGKTVEIIQNIRNGEDTLGAPEYYNQWSLIIQNLQLNNAFSELRLYIPGAILNCGQDYTWLKPSILGTQWGQDAGYNNLCKIITCNSVAIRGQTGCVATAMAQIIHYWKPLNSYNYNYNIMPSQYLSIFPSDNGNVEMQKLMRDAGKAVDMDYTCEGSSANDNRIKSALKNDFNIIHIEKKDYEIADRWTIKGNIDAGRPVMLSGMSSQSSFLFWTWGTGTGHVWICDGYKGSGNDCYRHFWYWMNWGWNGDHDGWYYQDEWDHNETYSHTNYQYQQHLFYNIYP